LMVTNLLEEKKVPVYGQGLNVRDWLFVEDNCRAIDLVLRKGRPGEAYNVGGACEKRNIDVVHTVLNLLGKGEDAIQFVPDRPGHDFRYALSNDKIERELGWRPQIPFSEGILQTVEWYQQHTDWWTALKARLAQESQGFWTKK
ncbi:MAG: GDP-mannose 4,6-dehydratase, partial [candidate division NC10 bacterium]